MQTFVEDSLAERPNTNPLTDETAEDRRRTRGQIDALGRSSETESGSSGSNSDFIEALLRAAMNAPFGRGGLGNSGLLAMASMYYNLRRRSQRDRGEEKGRLPDEHMRSAPVAQAAVHLLGQADPRVAARELPGADVQQLQAVQRNARFEDVEAVLHSDFLRGSTLERIARENLQEKGPDSDTPPEQLWRRGLDEPLDTSRMNAREVAMYWLSAAMSTEPGARDVQGELADALAEKHPQLWESIERGMAQDPNYVDDILSSRVDKATALAGAVWQADGRPLETMEEYWTKAVSWFKDKRADLNHLRDAAESMITAVQDGKIPIDHLNTAIDNAKQNIPGFAENYRKALDAAKTRTAGEKDAFPQGDAFLDALDQARGYPVKDQPRDRAEAARTAKATASRTQDPTQMAGPEGVLPDSRLPTDVGQVGRAVKGNRAAIARPQEQQRTREQRREEMRKHKKRMRNHKYREQSARRAVARDSRLPSSSGKPNERTRAYRAHYVQGSHSASWRSQRFREERTTRTRNQQAAAWKNARLVATATYTQRRRTAVYTTSRRSASAGVR